MLRSILTFGLAGMALISSAGCMCCDPCGTYASGPYMPMDSRYCGAVERGPLGGPQTKAAQRREMRRALRNMGFGVCPTCYGGASGYAVDPMMDGYVMDGGLAPAMVGGTCPTCQGQGHLSQFPHPEMGAPMMGPEMSPYPQVMPSSPESVPNQQSPMNVPVPMMEPTLETPTPAPAPAPTPAPGAPSANGTSQFYPTGMSPLFGGISSYQAGPSVSTPPPVQSFRPGAQPVSYQSSVDPMMVPGMNPNAQPMLTAPY